MNSSPPANPSASQAPPPTTSTDVAEEGSTKKVRKPYTITKSRESWTEEEHDKFLEALQLFDRDWKKIEDFVGSKTVIQIRSHAQKYFLKVQKNGTVAHVPPPRPKRKAAHPYPQKASKNAQVLLHVSSPLPSPSSTLLGYAPLDGSSALINIGSTRVVLPQDELATLRGAEGMGSISRTLSSSKILIQGKQAPVLHGVPDFAEVYNFIGSVFDPETKGHVRKLKEMDPINFETVLLLMRNLAINLSSPDFEPVRKVLLSYEVNTKLVAGSAESMVKTTDVSS